MNSIRIGMLFNAWFGFARAEVRGVLAYARENQLDSDTGVIVLGVQGGFPAAVAGLVPGDIVTKVNQQPVTELDLLKRAYQQFEAQPASLLVEAIRDRRVALYVLKP